MVTHVRGPRTSRGLKNRVTITVDSAYLGRRTTFGASQRHCEAVAKPLPMRRYRSRLFGLFSAIALAIPACAFAQPGYLCRVTGQVSVSCCCAGKHVSNQAVAELKQRSCCQIVQVDRTVVPSAPPDNNSRTPASPAMVASLVVPISVRDTGRPCEREVPRVTHPPGPPRFLVHCSFLI